MREGGGRRVGVHDDDQDKGGHQRHLQRRRPPRVVPPAGAQGTGAAHVPARLAAKKYARERSRVPSHIGSMLYDNFRTWRRYGKWTASGTTWEQVWNKYED